MENIIYVQKQIKSTSGSDTYIRKAKKERLDFYNSNIEKVNQMDFEKVKAHSFIAEVVRRAEQLRKLALLPKIKKQVVKLETHSFAPELNVLHFTKNRFLKVPQCKTIESALTFTIQTLSVEYLKTLTK